MSDGNYTGVGKIRQKGCTTPMKPISLDRCKQIAAEKNLKPGKVKGTTEVEFTRGGSARVDVIDWPEFEQIVAQKDLEIHEGGGFMKLMKKQ